MAAATKDITNFSSSSHRMPTVSASQALADLDADSASRFVRTGLPALDAILGPVNHATSQRPLQRGGLSRRQIAEVYGPPGVGKTALAMQASANALHAGEHVVWVGLSPYLRSMGWQNRADCREPGLISDSTDCASPIVGPRFTKVLSGFKYPDDDRLLSSSPPAARTVNDLLDEFTRYSAPTLPHLIALLLNPVPSFPPPKTSLIVIDSLSTLFNMAFSRSADDRPVMRPPPSSDDGGRPQAPHYRSQQDAARQWASNRRWAVMGDFISKVGKLAALNDLAVLITCQTTTRVTPGVGAVLVTALSSVAWDAGLASRIVLFRDNATSMMASDLTDTMEARPKSSAKVRFAGVIKAGGIVHSEHSVGKVVPFSIEDDGLRETATDPLPAAALTTLPIMINPNTPNGKRKREVAAGQDDEAGAGSVGEDEDEYGWVEDSEDEPVGLEGVEPESSSRMKDPADG